MTRKREPMVPESLITISAAFEHIIRKDYREKMEDVGKRPSYKYWSEFYMLITGDDCVPRWECFKRVDGPYMPDDNPRYEMEIWFGDKEDRIVFSRYPERYFFDLLKECGLYRTAGVAVDYYNKPHKEGEGW